MDISLDTTYFLPGFNIQIHPSIPKDCLSMLNSEEKINKIIFSDMVIFEANAKLSKQINSCSILNLGYKSKKLINLPQNTKFHLITSSIKNNTDIWELSCIFRQYHKDFVDCIHLATATVNSCSYFITEDKILLKFYKQGIIWSEIQKKIQSFTLPKIWKMKNLLNSFDI